MGVGFIDASRGYEFDAATLPNVWFRGDSGVGSQTLWAQAYDGRSWSSWEDFTFTTTPAANVKPVPEVADQRVSPFEWTLLDSVLDISDANGDAITLYEVWDSDGGNNWWADGGRVDASTGYQTADLSDIWFQGDPAAGTSTMWVRANDGTEWSTGSVLR